MRHCAGAKKPHSFSLEFQRKSSERCTAETACVHFSSLARRPFFQCFVWFRCEWRRSLTPLQWLLSLYLAGTACTQWKRGKNLVQGVDQNFPLFFTGQSPPLTRFFYLAINTLNKTFFLFCTSLYFSIYTFDKKSPQNRGRIPRGEELESESGGEVATDFDSRFGGIEATAPCVDCGEWKVERAPAGEGGVAESS